MLKSRRFQCLEIKMGFSKYSFKMLAVPAQNMVMPMARDSSLHKVRLNIFPGFSKVRSLRPHTDHEIALPKPKPQSVKYNL